MRCIFRHEAVRHFCSLLATALLLAVLQLAAPRALAQSSVGVATNTATGRTLADAVEQQQKGFIEAEVVGTVATGAAAGLGAAPSGRFRTSDHERLDNRNAGGPQTFPYATDEASVFANVTATVPGAILGGQVKVAGFVGHNWLSLDIESDSASVLDPNQFASARNDSIIVGGTVLWAYQSTYALATVVGFWGDTELTDSIDDCGLVIGCRVNRYRFDTAGFIATATAGKVFDLSPAPSGPKLDVRGSVSYTQNDGDPFLNVYGDRQEYEFSTWTGSAAVTLFANLDIGGGAVLRPYLQGYVRQEWDYQNAFTAIQSDGVFLGHFSFDQSHLYGGVDAGLTYAVGQLTVGAAAYYEGSGDESTIGGRLGASLKLN